MQPQSILQGIDRTLKLTIEPFDWAQDKYCLLYIATIPKGKRQTGIPHAKAPSREEIFWTGFTGLTGLKLGSQNSNRKVFYRDGQDIQDW
jgi:hypothetical protein